MNMPVLSAAIIIGSASVTYATNVTVHNEHQPVDTVNAIFDDLEKVQEARDFRIEQYARILKQSPKDFHAPNHMSKQDLLLAKQRTLEMIRSDKK